LGVETEGTDASGAARQPQFEPAKRLAVMAGDDAKLDVEIEIVVPAAALGIRRTAERRLHENAAIVDVAANHDTQHAVVAALRTHHRLVAIGGGENREVHQLD